MKTVNVAGNRLEVLTQKEKADQMHVHRRTINRWVLAGKFEHMIVRLPGSPKIWYLKEEQHL